MSNTADKPSPAIPDVGKLVELMRGDTTLSDRPQATELMLKAAAAIEHLLARNERLENVLWRIADRAHDREHLPIDLLRFCIQDARAALSKEK